MISLRVQLLSLCLLALVATPVCAQEVELPHGQDTPPGPALSPAEAIAKMKVPDGFAVELVASEPDIVNPVAMTFDERGRIWVTESFEYPRMSAGLGKDRVKVLEDTDGDGKADKVTVFAEGFNIPSGIAVGHGGVWLANSPDILFLQDTDGDGKADRSEVVVTGFGRDDTHELPNSLTWGPDGWLYGLNGVFNKSVVKQNGKEFRFTCALFRIHPKTREFQLFAEGTSNPWGVAWDNEGSAFLSACVIDHLWHLVETGYYHRQGGPYPPHTWKIESIVTHKHQKAAYCGIHYLDSDAYPADYKQRLFMGNIHGNCVNVDTISRNGATYKGEGKPDFLSANDPWFMPVVQKTGPDGSLYVLDWYDRYHCYQDAVRDAPGIDRLKGRLYRVRYRDTPRVWNYDLAKESDGQLIARLRTAPNDYFRQTIQRVLTERANPESRAALEQLALDDSAPQQSRRHALWTLIGLAPLDEAFHQRLLAHKDSFWRAWGVRAAGNMGRVSDEIRKQVAAAAHDDSPDVKLQVAIASRKINGLDPIPILTEVLASCGNDPLIPHIVWNNLHPLLEARSNDFVETFRKLDPKQSANVAALVPRIIERLLGRERFDAAPIAALIARLNESRDFPTDAARGALNALATRVQTRELAGDKLAGLRKELDSTFAGVLQGEPERPLYFETALLAASWSDPAGLAAARSIAASAKSPVDRRLAAVNALITSRDDSLLATAADILSQMKENPVDFRANVIAALGKFDSPAVADLVLARYEKLEPELQPRAIELLTQRVSWSKSLLTAIAEKKVPSTALNLSQIRRLLAYGDDELVAAVNAKWGKVR
ncbi:MAG: PVC-type heme-binding CxxCH protein, partial [Planctomycetaceae bacterium]